MAGADTYPVFEANQVLNHDHLNALREYLDTQDRLSRRALTGIGVVCGMHIAVNGQHHVTVSPGCGVTSEGYIVSLENEKTFTHYRDYTVPPDYQPLETATQKILELVVDTDHGKSLKDNGSVLNNKVVVAFLEYIDEKVESCLTDNCDEHGKWRIFQTRFLLVHKNDAVKIIVNGNPALSGAAITNAASLADALNQKYRIETAALKRICCVPSGKNSDPTELNFAGCTTYPQVARLYIDAARDALEKLPAMLEKVYDLFSPVLKNGVDASGLEKTLEILKALRERMEKMLDNADQVPLYVQYIYDFVKDLLCAYHEFTGHAFDLMARCCPDTRLFPRHLFLGDVNEVSGVEPSPFRTIFLQPPVYNGNAQRLKRTMMLFERIMSMTWRFALFMETKEDAFAKEWPVRITPSRGTGEALCVRSIPFYYPADKGFDSIQYVWDYDKSKKCAAGMNLSYHAGEYSDVPHVTTPLCYTLDTYPFFRIEGCAGKRVEEALESIEEIRNSRNLPFEVVPLYIGDKGLITEQADHGYEDLQVIYDIRRNKLLLFLNNLIWLTHTLEKEWLTSRERTTRLRGASKEFLNQASDRMVGGSMTRLGAGTVQQNVQKMAQFETKISELEKSTLEFGFAGPAGTWEKTFREYNRFFETAAGGRTPGIGAETAKESTAPGDTGYLSSEEKFIKDMLNSLNGCLRELIQCLVPDLKEFREEVFTGLLVKCLSLDIEIMKYIVSRVTRENYREKVFFMLQFCSWVHRFLSAVALGPCIDIRLLCENFRHRKAGSAGALRFFDFLKENKGLEHLAGVPCGGTFVLVYQTEQKGAGKGDDEFIKKHTGRVIADFCLPFVYRAKDAPRPVVLQPLMPLAVPRCLVLRPFDKEEKELFVFPENELCLLNNVYDPSVYVPEIKSVPKFGDAMLEDRVYEPDLSKKKKVLVYRVDPKRVKEALGIDKARSILVDEFAYAIVNTREKKRAGNGTISVFICTEPESKPKNIVTGTVYSLGSGARKAPLAGAQVADNKNNTQTVADANGVYTMPVTPGVTYTLSASAQGHVTVHQRITIIEGTNRLDFNLNGSSQGTQNEKFHEMYEEMKIDPGSIKAYEASTKFEERADRYIMSMEKIKADTGLKPGTPVYSAADTALFLLEDPTKNIVRINSEYEKTRNQLFESIVRSTGKNRELQVQAYKTLTLAYVDRLALEQPKQFSKTTGTVLAGTKAHMKELPELSMDKEIDVWADTTNGFLPDSFICMVSNSIAGKNSK